MKKILGVLVVSLVTSFSAKAGILIDPYFSYVSSGSADFASGASVTGTEMGARLGYDFFLGFGAGVDALLSGKYTYSMSGVSVDSTPSYYGVFVSYKFPILVRGYASYLLSLKEKSSNDDQYSGTGTKIGIQYTGLPFVALGLEMFSGSYDKYTPNGGSETSASDKVTRTNISLSVPFSL